MKQKIEDYIFPEDLKHMNKNEMELLSYQLREFLIDKLSKTGGHIASNLGAVELSIALHRYYNTPDDKIIWDVGHQSYVHKILTGRAEAFDSLRQKGGLSGFPKNSESESDAFDTGHSSTSISVAAGYAKARDLLGEKYNVISVIGDGSLTGGLAYEGLNNLEALKTKVIVVLNDNGMSIGKNTGGLSSHLNKVRFSEGYYDFKKKVARQLKKVPKIGVSALDAASKIRDSIKYSIVDGIMFEQLGLTYIGPIDGHNISEILEAFKLAETAKRSVLIHVVTKKGKGYINAEKKPSQFHGIGAFDKETGLVLGKSKTPSYSSVFGNKVLEMAKRKRKLVVISAAMIEGTGLEKFADKYADRCFDVGIAESHAVTFAGGLAKAGMKPIVAIYSTFLQRAYDNIILDVSMQKLPIIFAIDRAGIVGQDGETHHGLFDIAYLKNIPNMILIAPRDSKELTGMLEYAYSLKQPVAIRYPRGEADNIRLPHAPIDGRAEVLFTGADVEIWAVGNMTRTALDVRSRLLSKGINAGVVNARFISPIDCGSLMESARRTKLIVTLEDAFISGGFGESISSFITEYTSEHDEKIAKIMCFGWPKKFIEHGKQDELYELYGLDKLSITQRIEKAL